MFLTIVVVSKVVFDTIYYGFQIVQLELVWLTVIDYLLMFRIIEAMAATWRDGSLSGCKALFQTLLSLMWSQTVDNTKEFTDLLPKNWLLAIKVCSGLKYGLDTGRLIFSVGRRRGSLGMGRVANLGNCCGFRWCLLQRLGLLWHLTDFAHHLTSEASIALLLLLQAWWIIFLVRHSDHACLKVHHWLALTPWNV